MRTPITIKGGPVLGDKLYSMVISGDIITNPVRLLCRDGVTVKIVHRDVLQAASPFLRQIIIVSNDILAPVPVAVKGRILDLVIEFIYTTRINAVEIHELVELYAAADTFQLDELRMLLKEFFRSNIRDCLMKDELFLNRGFEEMRRFIDIFPIAIDFQDQVRLIQAIFDWAKKQGIDGARVCDLVARIVMRTPLEVTPKLAIENIQIPKCSRLQTIPLLISENQVLQVIHGGFAGAELPAAIVEKLVKSDSACITGNEVYIIKPNEIMVFDLITAEQLRTFVLPFDWRAWCEKLILRKGRVYTWHENEIYELNIEGFSRLCQTKAKVCDLAVIEQESNSFRFVYENKDKQTIICTGDGKGNIKNETPIPIANIELVGVYDDAVIICKSIEELMIYQNGAVVWKHFLGGVVEYIFCAGNSVYIKRPNDLYIVDIVSRSINTISPVPLGHFMIREILD